jgi:hypothetical protein
MLMPVSARTAVGIVLTVSLLIFLPEASAAGVLSLSPCEIEGLSTPARCGVLDVPENPRRPQGRHLAIHVAVVPATGGRALSDPLVPLMGGPGEDAISAAAETAAHLCGSWSTPPRGSPNPWS